MKEAKNRQKWALLIGIDHYKSAKFQQLKGCGNDIELISKIIQENFGFAVDRITILRNEEATRENILKAMDILVQRAGIDDIVVIHYSGHGSQMTDREGDEKDGLDETIVPYDSGRHPEENRDITDDEIYLRLLRLGEKTPHITLIFDCCHSATMSRDPFGALERWAEPDLRPIEELPPSPVIDELGRGILRDCGPTGWLPYSERYVLIAACRDEEKAYEYAPSHGITHGTLTYFLGQELRRVEPSATYRDIFERVNLLVTVQRCFQHPQMEGARDRQLFDVGDIKPMRFVSVQTRQDDRVTLGAGAAHGMTSGSLWGIYASGTKQIASETPRLGLVEVTAVEAVTSDAKILEEVSLNVIKAGSRSVEETHDYGEMCLVVEIETTVGSEQFVDELKKAIADSTLLQEAEGGKPAVVRIYLVPPRKIANQESPVPQLGVVAEPTWAAVGQDGQLAIPPQAANRADAAVVLRNNLEKVARYRQVLALRNPNEESPLKDKVKFILKRQNADGTWVRAEPEDSSGQVVFEEGDRIAAEIINCYSAPVYITILDFGLTGAVSLLHPIEGSNEQLIPDKSISIGVREGDEIVLEIPDEFSRKTLGNTETFKLFVTTQEADFSPITQKPFERRKGSEQQSQPLSELLYLAWIGDSGRDARRTKQPSRLSAAEEWTTADCSFFLKRRNQ
ncbi:MAG: caspase family protein [Limnoraphis sp. WC205]|nr:caspase family protein [Limnoraphis sp. WC205]